MCWFPHFKMVNLPPCSEIFETRVMNEGRKEDGIMYNLCVLFLLLLSNFFKVQN